MKHYKPATILGAAIGDAIGQPFEFCQTKTIIDSGWKGGFTSGSHGFEGMWNLKPGQWTDDTKMLLGITNSLLESGKFDENNLAQKYIEWVESRDLRGIGIQTERAIFNMIKGIPPLESGKKEAGRPKPSFKRISNERQKDEEGLHGIGDYCGCGTVMRCAPIGIFFENQEQRIDAAKKDAIMTHNHPDAKDSSMFLCEYISLLLNSTNIIEDCEKVANMKYEYEHVPMLAKQAIEMAKDTKATLVDGITLGVRGTAHETLASALFCFLKTKSFNEAITTSVLLGGDTDSRAAIVGAMAGTYYGTKGIPQDLIDQVEDSNKLQELDKQIYKNRIK